jgi:hypothetical protein
MLHVLIATDGSLYTGHDAIKVRYNPFDGARYPGGEVQKIVVLNRYQPYACLLSQN